MYKDKWSKTKMSKIFFYTFQEIRIIATGPCITNQLRDVNTICRRSWYIAAHIWKIYDFNIEVDYTYFSNTIQKVKHATPRNK
jgi:hypothetical protein